MYTDNGKKNIFDDVKPRKMASVDMPEFNDIKTAKHFEIKKLDLDNDLEKYNTTSFPEFNIVHDNELFNLWGFGVVEMMSLNPEYKYKYPKFSKSELIKQEWQTQEGVPNRLNQLLRAEESGASIQEIKKMDDDYQEGLSQLYTDIDKEANLINNELKSDGINDVILTEERKKHLKQRETQLKENRIKYGQFSKRYNPVQIKPAIANKQQYQNKIEREMNLLNEQKNDAVYLKTVKRPVIKSPIAQQIALQTDIKKGVNLKPTPEPKPKPPTDLTTDLTPEQIEENKEAFKKAIAEGKQKLKNKRVEKLNEEKSKRYENFNDEKLKRYENLQKQFNDNSKQQISHENLVLNRYDDVISTLQGLKTKKLSETQRGEINEMLKKIDNTNIGAIKRVDKAIERLQSKQGKIEELKIKILDEVKKQEAE